MPYGTIKVDNITFDNGGTDKLITVSGLFFSTSGALTVTGTISGGNVTAPTATFTTLTGTTTAGTTATFTSGSFTSLTGVTTTGTTATFTSGSFTSLTGVTTTVTSGVFSSGIVTAPSVAIGSGTTYKPGIYSPGTDQVAISTNGTGRLFIDSSGRLLVGTSTARSNLTFGGVGISPLYQVESTGAESSISITRNATNNLSNARLVFAKNNSATLGTNVLVDSGEVLGEIAFNGNDGTNFIVGANITGEVDGTPGANDMPGRLVFSTTADGAASPTERMRVDANGCVGVGMTPDNQAYRLQIYNSSQDVAAISLGNNVSGSGSSNGLVIVQNQTDTQILNRENGYLSIATNNTERARIDSSGRLLVGTSTARANFYNSSNTSRLQVEGTASDTGFSRISAVFNDNSANGDSIIIGKTRGSTVGSATAVVSQDNIGYLSFQAADGTELVEAASIGAAVDGTPGTNDMPGRLVFSTTADGASSPTERMRISNAGSVLINTTAVIQTSSEKLAVNGLTTLSNSSFYPLIVERKTNDGDLVLFMQDSTTEGSISVSGTTVSYNGAHLSRWSQLPGGTERTEILRGTVLSNVDEMCAWGDEDNEQLNRMKVSDVEGDPNVSGVFQAWDDDDDTYTDDFYCAMTGDFIIRIAEGVIVERGDLLMSAGDGTAKPQDDDIIRSKTVAKVTSTHVACTYEDGSYCVPCVLMAC